MNFTTEARRHGEKQKNKEKWVERLAGSHARFSGKQLLSSVPPCLRGKSIFF